jgi:hypothetical protein
MSKRAPSVSCPVTGKRYPLDLQYTWVMAHSRAPDQDYVWLLCECGAFHSVHSHTLLAHARAINVTEVIVGDYPPLNLYDEHFVLIEAKGLDGEGDELLLTETLYPALSATEEATVACFAAQLTQSGSRCMNYDLFMVRP